MTKPIVGITTFCKEEANKKHYNKVSSSYAKVIAEAGGTPILIPLMDNLDQAKEYIELIDALLLSGGQDISPHYYNNVATPYLGEVDSLRDKWEIKLFKLAYEENIPVLGICRGMQLINVAQGGTLYQDIVEEYNKKAIHIPEGCNECYVYHSINFKEPCNLCGFSSAKKFDVNSHHHQAIKDLAPGFKVIAETKGKIIEAIESMDKDFIFGVQWHPEDLTHLHPCFKKIFNIFIEKADQNNK
ncbi:gamma-glutamyl-gamma-aminobutyrate hydrolase family protein [Halonatronum saccharophilum]|uniref:gamma-glutamyl-gamma-aminobutyrate hydrolase family protein n=1 Tax=Halonatronum saccharophilum TaxID=150060 RepID=UPI00048213F7|nr:gamma-glutamyl-gamma-aminobutyrate hydrolase family protein [Halonatronum saccharophilum]